MDVAATMAEVIYWIIHTLKHVNMGPRTRVLAAQGGLQLKIIFIINALVKSNSKHKNVQFIIMKNQSSCFWVEFKFVEKQRVGRLFQ